MAARFTDETDLLVLFVNVGESFDTAYSFAEEAQLTLPVLLDEDQRAYSSYSYSEFGAGSAPFPRQVVVDREGIITWMSGEYDADEASAAIQAALDDE